MSAAAAVVRRPHLGHRLEVPAHGGQGGSLGHVAHVGGGMRLQVGGGRDHVGRADHPAHPPSRHGVGLGHPVDDHAGVGQVGNQHRHRGESGFAVDQVLVDLVGDHPQAVRQPPSGRWPRPRPVRYTAPVGLDGETNSSTLVRGRPRRLQLVHRDLEPVLPGGRHLDGHPPGQADRPPGRSSSTARAGAPRPRDRAGWRRSPPRPACRRW